MAALPVMSDIADCEFLLELLNLSIFLTPLDEGVVTYYFAVAISEF